MKELIIWLCAAILFGILEALLFHSNKNINKKIPFDIHIIFGFVRLCLFIPLLIYSEERFIFAISSIFMFPFLHDGFYYLTRNILSGGKLYPKTFFDQSTTTTAKISLGAFYRIILFLFGAGMIFVL
jgi:hypothetical protein